jgi:hypothetical protein
LSIRYTERLKEAGFEPSVGSVGDSYDNALAESIIGLYKPETTVVSPNLPLSVTTSHERLDIERKVAVWPGRDVEGHFLLHHEGSGLVPRTQRREAREYILAAAVGGEQSDALRLIDPFDDTGSNVRRS